MVWGGMIREWNSRWGIGERRDTMRDMVRLMDVGGECRLLRVECVAG